MTAAKAPSLERLLQRKRAFAVAHHSRVAGVCARARLHEPHRLAADYVAMHDPAPVDVLQMALLATGDEPDRRNIYFLAAFQRITPSTSRWIELRPPHQAPATDLSTSRLHGFG